MKETLRENHSGSQNTETVVREGNVVHIYKPEATYTIIYGVHVVTQDPSQLPEQFDGLFLEMAGNYPADPLGYLKWARVYKQYKDLFKPLEEKQIPIYFADLEVIGGYITPIAESMLSFAELAAGVVLTASTFGEKLTRRNFLKMASLGGSAWLSIPTIEMLLGAGSAYGAVSVGQTEFYRESYKRNPDPTKELRRTLTKLHPEQQLLTIKLRNSLISYKEEWLVKGMGNKPHLVTIMGTEHFGIEDELQDPPEKRLAFLHMMRPLVSAVVTPQTFYKIEGFDFDGNEWQWTQEYEIPELKAML